MSKIYLGKAFDSRSIPAPSRVTLFVHTSHNTITIKKDLPAMLENVDGHSFFTIFVTHSEFLHDDVGLNKFEFAILHNGVIYTPGEFTFRATKPRFTMCFAEIATPPWLSLDVLLNAA